MKIIGWTSFDSNCQGICVEEREILLEALNETLRVICDNEYLFSGETHQNGSCVVPVFDNGKCLRCSMRGWATLMSIAYTGDGNAYMAYYMDVDSEKLPQNQATEDMFVIDDEVNGLPFYYTNQDLQMVAESVSMGMQMMTFDKVILVLYEILKEHMQGE